MRSGLAIGGRYHTGGLRYRPDPDPRSLVRLKDMVNKGHLGRKAGRGFYRYQNGTNL
ncbi:MAG: hypothetical protein GY807_01430 [Gammaproteobacteria bacterium]|nr:hypothetical protein [Gammaproteobacteria bacterium]